MRALTPEVGERLMDARDNGMGVDSARRAKIVATLGPASSTEDLFRQLVRAGLDVARLNFSHGSHEQKAELIAMVRKVAREEAKPVCILADLQGPKIRTGTLVDHKPVMLQATLESIELMADAIASFDLRCARGIEPNLAQIRENVERSLMLVTALNPHIGYENAARIALHAHRENTSLREAAR